MTPAERAKFIRVARSKPSAETRHALWVIGSLMMGEHLLNDTVQAPEVQ